MNEGDIVLKKLKKYCVRSHTLTLQKGQSIDLKTPNPDFVYYLKKGFVRMYLITPCLHEVSIHFFKPNCYFSILSCLVPVTNGFLYEAFTKTELIAIPKNIFMEFIFSDREIIDNFYKRLTIGMNKLCMRLTQAYHCPAKYKVMSALFYFAKLFGKYKNGMIYITKPLTHEDIANFAGLTRENTSRILEEFKKEKILSLKYKKIVIKDLFRLEKEAQANKLYFSA